MKEDMKFWASAIEIWSCYQLWFGQVGKSSLSGSEIQDLTLSMLHWRYILGYLKYIKSEIQ